MIFFQGHLGIIIAYLLPQCKVRIVGYPIKNLGMTEKVEQEVETLIRQLFRNLLIRKCTASHEASRLIKHSMLEQIHSLNLVIEFSSKKKLRNKISKDQGVWVHLHLYCHVFKGRQFL